MLYFNAPGGLCCVFKLPVFFYRKFEGFLFKDQGQFIVGQKSQHIHSFGLRWKEKVGKPQVVFFFFITLMAAQDKIAKIVS